MVIEYPCTSLRSGHKAIESPFKWFLKDKEGYFKGIQENIDSEKVNMPRQDFPDVYIPDGYVDIIKTDTIIEQEIYMEIGCILESPCVMKLTQRGFKFLDYKIKNETSPIIKYHNN